MNNRKFDPTKDLPKCDICGATTLDLATGHGGGGLKYTIVFACGATWSAHRKLSFDRTLESIPDGDYTVWKHSSPSMFLEDTPCTNAAVIARKLRSDAVDPANWPKDEGRGT